MNAPRPVCRGFTLLELLVAMAITLVLAGLILAILSGVLAQWRRHSGSAEQAAAAGQALDALGRDLQAAIGAGGDRCFAVDIIDEAAGLANRGWLLGPGAFKPGDGASLRLAEHAPDVGENRFGLSGAWLRFITTNVESGGGLPIAVAYQVVRRPVTGNPVAANPAPVRYGLYRSAVSGNETFSNGYDLTGAGYGSTSNTPSSAMSTAYRQARNIANPSHANLLASNVVDFGCRLYLRDPGGELIQIFPKPGGGLSYRSGRASPNDRFPEIVDLSVRVLSQEGALLIESLEAGRLRKPAEMPSDAAWWWSIVEAHSRVFVRRIEIKRSAP